MKDSKYQRDPPKVLDDDTEELLLEVSRRIALDDLIVILNAPEISVTEAVDYWAVYVAGLTYREWSDKRGVQKGTVTKNVKRAKEKLADMEG